MPHQCITCGETFEDGSDQLLEGCPGCEGTQFFFTEDPLDEEEREELKEESPANPRDVVDELPDAEDTTAREMLEALAEEADDADLDDDLFSDGAWQDWVALGDGSEDDEAGEGVAFEPLTAEEEKTELRESDAVQVSLEDVQEAEAPSSPEGEDEPPELEPVEATDPTELAAGEAEARDRPSTLNISEPGQYEIDVERLMEDSPVIVERDGSFVIHLPSVFDKSE